MWKNWVLMKHLRGPETLELETIQIRSRKEDVGVEANLDGLQTKPMVVDGQNSSIG